MLRPARKTGGTKQYAVPYREASRIGRETPSAARTNRVQYKGEAGMCQENTLTENTMDESFEPTKGRKG